MHVVMAPKGVKEVKLLVQLGVDEGLRACQMPAGAVIDPGAHIETHELTIERGVTEDGWDDYTFCSPAPDELVKVVWS